MPDKQDRPSPGLVPPHGGYREVKSYRRTESGS